MTQSDKMFIISFIANMIKRHPRCVRLIHRKKKLYKENKSFERDPFKHNEEDPLKTKALKSSLWELETVIKSEFDEQVRNYTKLFKGDISRKTNFFKCEEFSGMDALASIADDIKSIDIEKETKSVNKILLIKNGQYIYKKIGAADDEI